MRYFSILAKAMLYRVHHVVASGKMWISIDDQDWKITGTMVQVQDRVSEVHIKVFEQLAGCCRYPCMSPAGYFWKPVEVEI